MTESIQPLDQFKDTATAYLPGLIVLFDLADTKRRNCHLGHLVVDQDIEEFDRLIQSSTGQSGYAKRVRGASWLAIYPLDSVNSLNALLREYQEQKEIEIGWRSTSEKDGTSKTAERTVRTTISRALRCLYSTASTQKEMTEIIDELFEQYYGLPPDIAIQLRDLSNHKRVGWNCITNHPAEIPFCAFCERNEFNWDEGDGAPYSGCGTCKYCGAYISIQGIQQLLEGC